LIRLLPDTGDTVKKKPMRTQPPWNTAITCQCFCCKKTIKEVNGFRFDPSVLEIDGFKNNPNRRAAFKKMVQDEYSTSAIICADCAAEVMPDGRPAFVRVYAQGCVPFADAETPHSTPRPTNEHRTPKQQDPAAFATAVLDNDHYAKHRKEELPNGGFINYCDCCGCNDYSHEMMGIINQRGNGAWAMCPTCFAKAKEELGDKLPELTFRQALREVMKITRPRPVQPPAPPAPKAKKPARTPRPSKSAGEDISEAVPMPTAPAPAPFVSSARRLDSIKAIYDALMEGDDRVRFGGTNKETMLTGCTVHATQSRLCKTPNGAGWEQMRSVIKDGKAFPFCPECAAQLTISGVRLEMTHKEAMMKIGAATNGNGGGGINRERMEFADPTARVKKTSNARKRELAAAEAGRIKLQRMFADKLAAIDRQIADECAKLKPIQNMAAATALQLARTQEDLRKKQDELNAVRESADSDTIEFMKLEIAELQERVRVLEADATAANQLLAEQKAEVDATVAKIQTIRDQVESAGPAALREKKSKGKNGGSKAA
jgi:hypothetical protein